MTITLPRWCLVSSLLLAPFTLAHGAEHVIKEYSFTLTDIDRIEIHGAVGSVRLIHADAPEVKVVLDIREQDDHWFGLSPDLDDVELESDVRGSRLVLRQTDEDLNIDWTIELPTVAETSVEFGVGKIEGEFGATELNVNLGVGDVDLTLPKASVGDIDLSVGVGDASLRGVDGEVERRAFVSQDVSGRGDGNQLLDVELGVGQIRVDLDD